MVNRKEKMPSIRYEGFTDDWEQRKLGELSERLIVGLATSVTPYYRNEGTPILRNLNIKENYLDDSDILFLDDEYADGQAGKKIHTGDVLTVHTGYIGTSCIVPEKYDGCLTFTTLITTTNSTKLNGEFLSQYLNSEMGLSAVQMVTTQGGRQNLNTNDFVNVPIPHPSIDEQKKICDILRNFDNLITLHQRKYDKLVKLKKSLLVKMFPQEGANVPEIRFEGFTDDWEQCKLSELATMHARIGWQNLRTSEFLDQGDYMLITGTDFDDGKINYSTCHYVEKERYDQDPHIQIQNGNILITKDGTLGKVAYVQGLEMPATLNAGVFNVEIRDENYVDGKYLFQYLKAPFLMNYVSQKATGGTIKHLNQNILVDFPVVLPSKAEQEKIGQYFDSLDNLITLHQCKLKRLKDLKHSMLNKMFPN